MRNLAVSFRRPRIDDLDALSALAGDTLAGFFLLERVSVEAIELEAMFVAPGTLRTGVGRSLMQRACDVALEAGASRMVIQSDPYAEGFYLRMGARRVGERASHSIPGRMLPVLELSLRGADEETLA